MTVCQILTCVLLQLEEFYRVNRPNILHLFSDQQRADSIQALGAYSFLQTPHLDRLCAEGTAFRSAYTPAAECVPSRACMITGMYADKTRCGCNLDSMPPAAAPTLMSLLHDSGYYTHGVGKCHFTPDPWALRGFSSRDTLEEIAQDPDGDDYLRWLKRQGFDHVLEPHGIRGEMYYTPQPSQLPAELHPTQWVGDRSISFIEREKDGDRPWYLYAGFVHPHPPFAPPNPWHKLYRGPEMPPPVIPEKTDELLCYINHFQNRFKFRDQGLDAHLIGCIRAYYFACVSFIDFQVGRVLAALEATGQLENTLIVFSSDHGELLGDFGCFGKRSFHEASQKIPLIVRQPSRFEAGATCDEPASLVDLLPTFLAAAGLETPAEADGMDLAALARGEERGMPIHFHYARGEDAIIGAIDEGWKYIWSAPDARAFLFDRNEPTEQASGLCDGRSAEAAERLSAQVRNRAALYSFSSDNLDSDGEWLRRKPKEMSLDPMVGLLYQDVPCSKPQLPTPYILDYPKKNILGL